MPTPEQTDEVEHLLHANWIGPALRRATEQLVHEQVPEEINRLLWRLHQHELKAGKKSKP